MIQGEKVVLEAGKLIWPGTLNRITRQHGKPAWSLLSGTTCNSLRGYVSLSQEHLHGCRCGAGRSGFRIWLDKCGRERWWKTWGHLNQSLLSAAPDFGLVLKAGWVLRSHWCLPSLCSSLISLPCSPHLPLWASAFLLLFLFCLLLSFLILPTNQLNQKN